MKRGGEEEEAGGGGNSDINKQDKILVHLVSSFCTHN